MPIYEYECPACGHRFEVFRRMSDSPDGACPHCSAQARRLFHPVGVIFKGTGFYSTDYKNRAAKNSPAKAPDPKAKDAADTTKPVESPSEKGPTG